MPKITLLPSAARDKAIAADTGRIYLEFAVSTGGQEARWSFGNTYTASDSQTLQPGDMRIFEGTLAQQAFSFGSAPNGTVIDITSLS